MKTKFSGILTLLLAFVVQFTFAQEKTITGTVTDETGPLPGVSVVIKGTTIGAETDFDGKYTINAKQGDILRFSFVGMSAKEVTVGVSNTINVVLEADNVLEEVVVTAQGIRREKKALGYAVTTISDDAISSKPETDVVRALNGKAAGVNIAQTSGLSGSGTNIIIRGYSSITQSNQALFVVDGVPFNTDTNNDRSFVGGGSTASSRFLDLDPNNIKSISILKGLSATTLYGEAGKNGVVLVTTKTGSGGATNKKMEISINQSIFLNEVANLPDYQNNWGNGFYNAASAAFSNWGANFADRGINGVDDNGTVRHPYDRADLNAAFPEFVGARYDYKPYNSVERFFKTGTVASTSIGVKSSSNDGKFSYSANYGRTDDEGFTPGNNYRRNVFSLGGQAELANGLKLNTVFDYIRVDRNTPPAAVGFGSNPSGASLFANLLYTPRSVDLIGLPFENPVDNSSIYYRSGNDIQNPLWTSKYANDNEKLRRFRSSNTLSYQLNDWSNISYRLGIESYAQRQKFQVNRGGPQIAGGQLTTSIRLNTTIDHTLSYTFNTTFGEDFNFDGVVGFNARRQETEITSTSSTNQFVFGLMTHQNFQDHVSANLNPIAKNVLGLYTSLTLGYKDIVFFNTQVRNDWASNLEATNRQKFYPSASLSWVLTGMEGVRSDKVNFLKLRVGYGSSAGFPDAFFATRDYLATGTNAFVDPVSGAVVNTNALSTNLGNSNLKPELHTEIEAGLEAKFFNNRIGIDLSVYDRESKDLILPRSLDPATGFASTIINAADVSNKGIELGFNATPLKSEDFSWDISGSWTVNENLVDKLAEGIDNLPFAGFAGLGNYAEAGQGYGIIKGFTIQRDDNGNLIVGGDGNYLASNDIGTIGDPNPDWNLTGITNITYKGIGFRMQWDYQHGGDIYSTTAAALISRGLTKDTDFDRTQSFILPGVLQNGQPNNIAIAATDLGFVNSGFFIDEQAIYDATSIRLREVSLSYALPKKLIDKTPFGSMSISFIGQNLWFKAVNFPKYLNFDPEVLSLGVGNGRGFDFLTGPTAKKYGFNINVTF